MGGERRSDGGGELVSSGQVVNVRDLERRSTVFVPTVYMRLEVRARARINDGVEE